MKHFINQKLKILKKRSSFVIIFFSVYFIGFLLGIIFSKRTESIFYINANNYHIIIFDVSISPIKCVINCLFSGTLLTVSVFAFGFSKFTVPLETIIIFYRGLVLGASAILFFTFSGVIGLLTFIILTLPCNLLITSGLTVASVLNYNCILTGKNKTLTVLKNCLIGLTFTLIASLYTFLILTTVIRPVNLIF